jgi:hypothetical protein
VKHDRYLRRCAVALAEHFKLRAPAVEEKAAPPAIAAPNVMAPVATLTAVTVVMAEWVKEGKLSRDIADRYVVDFLQRNGVFDFTKEPPPLPAMFLIRAPQTPQPQPAPPTNGRKPAPPFKAAVRGPFKSALDVYSEVHARFGGKQQFHDVRGADDIHKVAAELNIFEHSFWGKFDSSTSQWLYDVDAVRMIFGEIDKRLHSGRSSQASA